MHRSLVLALLLLPSVAFAQPPADSIAEDAPPPPTRAEEHPFSIGASVHGGIFPNSDSAQGYWFGAVELGFVVAPGFAFGVTDLAGGSGYTGSDGDVGWVRGGLYGEIYGFPESWLQLFLRAALAVQIQGETSANEGAFHLLPSIGAGTRFWVLDNLSLGLEMRFVVVATENVILGFDAVLADPGTFPLSLGGVVTLHL